MFNNIGGKIKDLAMFFAFIGIIISCISGVMIMTSGEENCVIIGLGVMVVGSLVAWISSWILYGYGELIEKASETAENTRLLLQNSIRNEDNASQARYSELSERINKLNSLRQQGLINEEEYRRAISEKTDGISV